MSEASGQVSGEVPHGRVGPSQALTSYLSASPTITERISNNVPDRNRKKRLEEKMASLEVKIKDKTSGKS